MIDTLELRLGKRIDIEVLEKRAANARISVCRKQRLLDRYRYLTIAGGLYFREYAGKTSYVVLQLSRFGSFDESITLLTQLIGEPGFRSAELVRVDVCVDIPGDFQKTIRMIDMPRKRYSAVEHEGSIRTGLRLGKGAEVLRVYDKGLQLSRKRSSRGKIDLTRIELQLRRGKLPCKMLCDLAGQFSERSRIQEAFDEISLKEITFCKDPATKCQIGRIEKLSAYVDCYGYTVARRKLDKQRSFKRDYGKLHQITRPKIQPGEMLRSSIENNILNMKNRI